MKVKELIEELQKHDLEKIVVVPGYEGEAGPNKAHRRTCRNHTQCKQHGPECHEHGEHRPLRVKS